MKLKTMVVDDAAEARVMLEQYCKKNEHIELVAMCADGKEGLEILKNQEIDLVFLDVEMPGMNGIDFLNQAPALPMVIFSTSKAEYAYHAYEFEAVDYLKKPINYPRFKKAVKKAVEHFHHQFEADRNSGLVEAEELPKSLFIKERGRHIRLNTDDILYFENVGDYVRIFVGKEQFLIYSTLKNIAAKLPPNQFLRVHRSYIVNLDKIVDIEENTLVIGRTVIPIGKAHKSTLLKRITLL